MDIALKSDRESGEVEMTEFKKALRWLDTEPNAPKHYTKDGNEANRAICRRALLIADRLTDNQSQETIQAGIDSYNKSGPFAVLQHFKAMRDQLIREIDNA